MAKQNKKEETSDQNENGVFTFYGTKLKLALDLKFAKSKKIQLPNSRAKGRAVDAKTAFEKAVQFVGKDILFRKSQTAKINASTTFTPQQKKEKIAKLKGPLTPAQIVFVKNILQTSDAVSNMTFAQISALVLEKVDLPQEALLA